MIKKLKRKFVIIVMTLVGLVLAGVLGSSLYSQFTNQRALIEDCLDRTLEGSIDSVPVIGGRHGSHGSNSPTMLALSVEISSDGMVLETSDSPVNINASTLNKVISEVLDSDKTSGVLRESHVSWKSAQTDAGSIRIAIVDTAAADSSFQTALLHDLEIIACGLVVMLVITWFLADWALAPVSKAWEQQKRFVADASHELKTPLAVILANTDILRKDKGIPEESRRWIESTADEAGHMKALVNDLLQLARADESAAGISDALQKEDVDLSEVVSSAALEFDAVAFERGCSIEEEVEEGIHVTGDREWLERLTKILIDNAVKYSSTGGDVRVSLNRRGKGCLLEVNNHGAVISKDDLAHIFDRFYRSDKARSREGDGAGGFGLGLAIAKGIAEAHGGQIRCTSTEDEGTTFSVTL